MFRQYISKQKIVSSKNISIFAIILIIVIQIIFGINTILGSGLPNYEKGVIPSYDAYYWIEVSKTIQREGDIPSTTPNTYVTTPINYPTSHCLLFTLISLFSDIEIEETYRFAGPLIFSFLIFLSYIVIRRILTVNNVKNTKFALFGAIILGMIPYNLYRSIEPNPEGFSLIFELLIVLSLLINTKNLNKTIVIITLLSGVTYMHYRSLAIPIFVLFTYCIVNYFQCHDENLFDEKSVKDLIIIAIALLIFLLLILPIFKFVLEQYKYYLSSVQYSWKELEPVPERYIIPNFNDYLQGIGFIPFLFGSLAIFIIIKNFSKKISSVNFTVLMWFFLTLLLTQSMRFGFYAPYYRFYSYMSIPLSILSAYGIAEIFPFLKKNVDHKKVFSLLISIFLVSTLTLIYVNNNVNKSIHIGFIDSDFDGANWLKNHAENSITISYSTFSIHLGVPNSEGRYEIIHEILSSHSSEELDRKLNEIYPNDMNVYFFVTSKIRKSMIKKYPHIENILKNYELVFRERWTCIYKLR